MLDIELAHLLGIFAGENRGPHEGTPATGARWLSRRQSIFGIGHVIRATKANQFVAVPNLRIGANHFAWHERRTNAAPPAETRPTADLH